MFPCLNTGLYSRERYTRSSNSSIKYKISPHNFILYQSAAGTNKEKRKISGGLVWSLTKKDIHHSIGTGKTTKWIVIHKILHGSCVTLVILLTGYFLASQYTTRSLKNINYIRNVVYISVAAVVRQKGGRKTTNVFLLWYCCFCFSQDKKKMLWMWIQH